MTIIGKQPLETRPGIHAFEAQGHGEILSFHVQRGIPTIWHTVPGYGATMLVRYLVIETGKPAELVVSDYGHERDVMPAVRFLGTALLSDGDYVLHYFQLLNHHVSAGEFMTMVHGTSGRR